MVGTLNLLQTFVAIAIGCTVIGIVLMIDGQAGHKYGIPFMVQAHPIPAIVWFGFQGWIFAILVSTPISCARKS